jgi:hypothetical protein
MYNLKKRFGTINMTKEIEDTILSDTQQKNDLLDQIEEYKNIIIIKDNEIKWLTEDKNNYKLQIETLKELIKKDDNKKLNESVDNNIVYELSFSEICNIPLPYITIDEEVLLNPKENIESVKKIYDNQNSLDEFLTTYGLKNQEDLVNVLEKAKDIINIPTPSSSTDNNVCKGLNRNKEGNNRHRFEDKSLPILERCNVIKYKYNNDLNIEKNKKALQIIDFISSEHKIIVKFNSCIDEQATQDDKEIWNEIYNFKIENGELSNKNKSQFKNKVIRCKQLYDKYEENLSRFQIYVNYIGRLNSKEWNIYLEEFDKLYNDTLKNEPFCKHKYVGGKICNRVNCKVKHREEK